MNEEKQKFISSVKIPVAFIVVIWVIKVAESIRDIVWFING